MKISLNWLKEYIDIKEPIEEISAVLTGTGLEVEGLESFEEITGGLEGIVIGEVMECAKHPDADKLQVTKVDIGPRRACPYRLWSPERCCWTKSSSRHCRSNTLPIRLENRLRSKKPRYVEKFP